MSNKLSKGRCQCGAVEYSIKGEIEAFFCHCEDCRLNTAALFAAWGRVHKDAFTLLKGKLNAYNSSEGITWSSCDNCGTSIKYVNFKSRPDIDFHVATLQSDVAIQPKFHVQVKEKLPWIVIADGLPQYQRWRRDAV